MLDLQKDYLVVHAILGVQRLRTCVAVPVVTTANAMATVGGHTIYKVKGTQVLTAHGRVPDDKLDARCGAEPWARGAAPCRSPPHAVGERRALHSTVCVRSAWWMYGTDLAGRCAVRGRSR